jgi:hypothetical protein
MACPAQITWWRFFGDLFALVPVATDSGEAYTQNPWIRFALIKMITPSEYMEVYLQASKPANDNDGAWWLS